VIVLPSRECWRLAALLLWVALVLSPLRVMAAATSVNGVG
jgi:hypothetical protein